MPLLLILFFFSGATGLVYELIWTRQMIFLFGGTTYAIATVLVAFMGGLGLGSYLAGRWAARVAQPGRLYGLLELCIGVYALCVPWLLSLAEPAYRAMYPHVAATPLLLNAARFGVGALTLLLPTLCMGATLPILVRFVTARGQAVGYSVGMLYGINTLGAVVGVVATGFVLIPTLGLTHTTWIAASANFIVGVAALLILRLPRPARQAGATAVPDRAVAEPAAAVADTPITQDAYRAVLTSFAVSGFCAMVYQITWTRVLILAIGSSTYSFTSILASFILGLALGSIVLARRADRWSSPLGVLGWVQLGIGVSAALTVPLLGHMPVAVAHLIPRLLGHFDALLAIEFLLVLGITIVPTLLMGAVFPLVTRIVAARMRDAGAATGFAYLINTIGTIAGSFLAGFVLIRSDVLGVQNSIWFAVALNCVAGLWLVRLALPVAVGLRRQWQTAAWVGVAAVPLVAFGGGRWNRHVLTSAPFLGHPETLATAEERRLLYYAEGVDLTVAVEADAKDDDLISLTVNGKADASTTLSDLPNMLLLGHLGPLLGNGGPDACMIGLGGGLSLGALTRYPWLERIDCVEISSEVIRAAEFFEPFTYHALSDPRVRLIRADGRNHLLLTDRRYDVIVSQPSNPWIAGVSNLFTKEYFDLCHARLKPGGVFVAWLQSYGLGVDEFRMVVHTLASSFDFISVWDTAGGDYLFVAGDAPFRIPLDRLRERVMLPTVRADLLRLGIHRLGQLLGAFIAADGALRAWSADAALHTDDNALLEFAAPRRLLSSGAYEIDQKLAELQQPPWDELIVPGPPSPARDALMHSVQAAAEARVLRNRAYALRAQGDVGGALEAFAEGYRKDPGNIGISYGYHYLLSKLRHASLDLQGNPKLRDVLVELNSYRGPLLAPIRGGTLEQIAKFNAHLGSEAFAEGFWTMAGEYFEVAVELLPDNIDLKQALAASYARSGRLDEAIALIDEVLKRDPGNGAAHFLRGQFAVFAEDFDTAIAQFEFALRAGAIDAKSLRENAALAAIRADPRFEELLAKYSK